MRWQLPGGQGAGQLQSRGGTAQAAELYYWFSVTMSGVVAGARLARHLSQVTGVGLHLGSH